MLLWLLAAAALSSVRALVHRSGVVVLNEGESIQYERHLLKHMEKYLYPVKLHMRMNHTLLHCYSGIPSAGAPQAGRPGAPEELLTAVCALLSDACASAKFEATGAKIKFCPCRALNQTSQNVTLALWANASAVKGSFNNSISFSDVFDTVVFEEYVFSMTEAFAQVGYDELLTVTLEGQQLQGFKVYNNLIRLQPSSRARLLTRRVAAVVAGKHANTKILTQVVHLRGLAAIGQGDVVVYKHLRSGAIVVLRVRSALNKHFYYLDHPVDLTALAFLLAIRDDLMKHYDIGQLKTFNCTLVVDADVVVGSPDCSELDELAAGKVVLVGHHLRTFIIPVAAKLASGRQVADFSSSNLYHLQPGGYLIVERGYRKPPPQEALEVPALIKHSLDLWSIDASVSHPQFIANPLLSLQGNNLILVAVTKLHQHNNVRLLLHSGDNPYDEDAQLFFIDIDEANNVYISNIKTGKNLHGSFLGDGHTVAIAIYITQTRSIVVCNSFVECDVHNVLLIFDDDDLALVDTVNVNQLDTYSISIDSFIIKRQLLPKIELYAAMMRAAGFAHVDISQTLPHDSAADIAGTCSTPVRYLCDPSSNLFLELHGPDSCRLEVVVRSNMLCRKGKFMPMNFDSAKTVCLIDNERNQKIVENIDKRIDRLYNSIADK